MKLSLPELKPTVRFAYIVERVNDYPEFLFAYDYRLFYVISGTMQFIFNNKTIYIKQGDLLIFPPATPYKIKYPDKIPAKYILMNFDFDFHSEFKSTRTPQPESLFNATKIFSNAYYPPFNHIFFFENANFLEDDIRAICYEHEENDAFRSENISALMKVLIIKLLRKYEQKDSNSQTPICDAVARYINLHYSEELTNMGIAKQFGYHPYYLSSVFMKYRGMTLHKYITNVRLEKAKKELIRTHDSIGEIAERCGFSNQSYFAECFKATFGKSPSIYRNQAR